MHLKPDHLLAILGGLTGGAIVAAIATGLYQLRGAGPRRRRQVARDVRTLERSARP